MKKLLLSIIILVFLFLACTNNKSPHTNEKKTGNLILIFDNSPNNISYSFPSGLISRSLTNSLISFINKDGISIEYTPKEGLDTLEIQYFKSSHLEILHNFRGIEEIYFLLQWGDTVRFSYDTNSYPRANSYTSPYLSVQYNFPSSIKNRRVHLGFESYSLLSHSFYRKLDNIKKENPDIYNTVFMSRQIDSVDVDSLKVYFKIYKNNFRNALDSLYHINTISKEYFNYYSYLLENRDWGNNMNDRMFSSKTENTNPDKIDFSKFFNDSYVNYISYDLLVKKYFSGIECRREVIPKLKSSNGINSDTRIVFDTINSGVNIPPKTKTLMFYYCLEDIIENFSVDDIKNYLEKYIAFTNDSIRANYLINKYNLDFESSNELSLMAEDDSKITFEELLLKHKGKLIYVDFWASWCAPCRRSMPDAKKIREEYKNKDIVFIYLALNDEKKEWIKAINETETNYLGENYFITNSKTSKFLETNSIVIIPRYILFDKGGNIIYKNAPGPGSELIRTELNKLLK